MASVDGVDRTVFVDAHAVRAKESALWLLDATAKETGQRVVDGIVKTYPLVLVVGDDDVIIEINGNVLGRIQLSSQCGSVRIPDYLFRQRCDLAIQRDLPQSVACGSRM